MPPSDRGRRDFLRFAGLTISAAAARTLSAAGQTTTPAQHSSPPRPAAPKGSEFVFARLRYDSGDWDYNPMVAAKLPKTHALYRSFFDFPDGPPQTLKKLNGWGDDLVHEYLRGVEHKSRLGVLYSNKDYGCEWDYDWRNKRFFREDKTKFAVNIVNVMT